MVDFIKWTSSFGEDAIKQMEAPLRGVRLMPSLSPLFGIAFDDMQPMIAMHADEAPWLAHLPMQMALTGYGDALILVTEEFSIFDQAFPSIGIEIYIPFQHREALASAPLLGFGHVHAGTVQPVNRIVPVYSRQRYESERRAAPRSAQETSLFTGV